ncbi:MAG: amidohydrolase [Isosphaeraceae bacterium]
MAGQGARILTIGMAIAFSLEIRAAEPETWFDEHVPGLVALYKDLHRNPELSFQEVETSRRLAAELRKAGAEVTEGVGKFGVVGLIRNGKGPTVLVRSDMDALPVTEETPLEYASKARAVDREGKSVGVMHACGHDVHMACLVGTARWLSEHKDRWSGTVVLIGQPAEEAIGGAKAMLADGLYTRFPKPDYALALHVTNDQPAGKLAYTSGPALAGSTSVNLTFKGRGGHGAAPHLTIDPIVLAALAIVDFQSIVAREIDPLTPSVLTVGSIHGGTKHNIIPDDVKLQLTLRAYGDDVRDRLIRGIRRRLKGLSEAHGAPEASFEIAETTPPTINTPKLVERIIPVFRKEFGESQVAAVPPVMGAEDFGLYGRDGVPTFMFRLGSINPEQHARAVQERKPLPSLHSATYYPDAPASIRMGVRAMSCAVVELLPPA